MSYQTRVRDALTSREQSLDICRVETALSWIFSLSFFSGLVNQSLTLPCVKYVSLSPSGFGGSVTSTLQSEVRVPWHGSAPSTLHLRFPASAGSARFGPPYRDRMELRGGSASGLSQQLARP